MKTVLDEFKALHEMRKRQVVLVRPDADELGKFRVFVNGGVQLWTLDRIKQSIADGDDVKEWE